MSGRYGGSTKSYLREDDVSFQDGMEFTFRFGPLTRKKILCDEEGRGRFEKEMGEYFETKPNEIREKITIPAPSLSAPSVPDLKAPSEVGSLDPEPVDEPVDGPDQKQNQNENPQTSTPTPSEGGPKGPDGWHIFLIVALIILVVATGAGFWKISKMRKTINNLNSHIGASCPIGTTFSDVSSSAVSAAGSVIFDSI